MPGTRRVVYSQQDGWHFEEVPLREARIDLNGLQLGPRVHDPRSYDERNVPDAFVDVSGHEIDGP